MKRWFIDQKLVRFCINSIIFGHKLCFTKINLKSNGTDEKFLNIFIDKNLHNKYLKCEAKNEISGNTGLYKIEIICNYYHFHLEIIFFNYYHYFI